MIGYAVRYRNKSPDRPDGFLRIFHEVSGPIARKDSPLEEATIFEDEDATLSMVSQLACAVPQSNDYHKGEVVKVNLTVRILEVIHANKTKSRQTSDKTA